MYHFIAVVTIGFSTAELVVTVAPTLTLSDLQLVKTGSHDGDISVRVTVTPGAGIGTAATQSK